MLDSTKKKINNTKIVTFAQMILIVVALATWLILKFTVGKEGLGFQPFTMLFIVYFMGAGLFNIIFGIVTKNKLMIRIGGVLLVIGLEFLFFAVAPGKYWWLYILVGIVLLVVLAISTFAMHAEQVEIEFDNQPDAPRKTYWERKAEEAKAEPEEEKPLPEIKSFKD